MDPSYNTPNTDDGVTAFLEERITKSNGETIIRKYAKGRLLGKGGFAKCYQVTNLDSKRILAAKVIDKASLTKSRARQKLISEIKIHKSLQHQYIVSFEHVFEDQENVYILLELCTNQTLNELLKRRKRLTELEVQCYLMQLVPALKHLHGHRVIHRDLKLGNLFLNDKMEIKIGDFGLATKVEFEGEKKKTICGTPNYIAPEVLDGKCGHSYEVDTWSLGVIIYTLLIGKPPYETPDVKTTYKKIRMNSYSFPDHVPISETAKSLIVKILNLDPSKRPTMDEILEHPFLNHGGTIPKALPVSTLVCPPSASYVKQFLPQASSVKIAVQPQRLVDTAPLGNLQNNNNIKLQNNQRNNLVSTERLALKKGQSSENVDKQTEETGASSPFGTMNLGFGGSTNSLKVQSAQQINNNNFKSSQGLRSLQSSTNMNLGNNNTATYNNTKKEKGKTDIYVKKWVDYSTKYGMGYLLSNGTTGVFFNDSTKIILDARTSKFNYVQRQSHDKQELVSNHSLTDYPKDLQKKVTLLQHFRSYLEGENKEAISAEEEFTPFDNLVYVKKWMKTKHAVMFRLSNKIVQVNFTDKTEIILSSEKKMVTYVNKKGERSQYPLATALESTNAEMAKRLKYTKEILTNMLGNNQQPQPQGKGCHENAGFEVQSGMPVEVEAENM
jgi:polo-like kinase 1